MRRNFDRVLTGGVIVSSILVLSVMILITIDVVLRYGFNAALWVVEEISEISIIYMVMLATAWVMRGDGHVSIDVFLTFLKPRGRAIANATTYSLGVLVCALIVVFTSMATWKQLEVGAFDPRILNLPIFWYMLPIPIGTLALLIEFVRKVNGFRKVAWPSRQSDLEAKVITKVDRSK